MHTWLLPSPCLTRASLKSSFVPLDLQRFSIRTRVYVCARIDKHVTITIASERQLHEGQLHEGQLHELRDDASEELLPTFWISHPPDRLHFVHEIAVPISRSPQHSWWGLILAETRSVQWVTSHNTLLGSCGSSIVHVYNIMHVLSQLSSNF